MLTVHLFFMIRGITKKYKQTVGYSFCSGSTNTMDLVRQIPEIITKLQETGLTVIATVCDQGATNKSAINNLIQLTKSKKFNQNKSWQKNTFEVNGHEII